MGQVHADSNLKQDQPGPHAAAWFRSYMHGGTSSLVSTLTTLLTFPVYKTVFRQQLHSTSVRGAVAQLYREGPWRLYRGVAPPLLMRTLNGTLLFGLQGSLLERLSSWAKPVFPGAALQALAGLGTGVAEALVFTPFERVQNVLQNSGNDRSLPTLRSVLARLSRQTLASGYYRALLPILVRNALGNSLYFGLKDPTSSALRDHGISPIASSFMSGVVNSIVISLPLYPLSVLVANMQAGVGGESPGVRASALRLWQARQCRVALLYRGGLLVVLRSCITWGITTAIYDQLERRAG
ncbi:solute carrier family 25 member 53-like [Brachyhypopomus gauderio]|uniref:solute carrier family 25 member 53-like n=1 Tax=Brachyhypopomus gauderio TaxID=698409 RepID=UPI00404125B1